MLKIIEIVHIQPYEIIARFSSNELRRIDLTSLVEKFPSLKNPNVFSKAKIDDYPTIARKNLGKIRELDGSVKPCASDFSPETLPRLSVSMPESLF